MALRLNDWFHTIISWNVYRIVLIFSLVNVIAWVLFGGLLYRISDECDLSLDTYQEALMLAIITMSTIGYGVQSENPYLQGCGSGIVVIGIFVLLSIILDALMIGIIMQVRSQTPRRTLLLALGAQRSQVAYLWRFAASCPRAATSLDGLLWRQGNHSRDWWAGVLCAPSVRNAKTSTD